MAENTVGEGALVGERERERDWGSDGVTPSKTKLYLLA